MLTHARNASNTVPNFYAHLVHTRARRHRNDQFHALVWKLMKQLRMERQIGLSANISRNVSQLPCNEFFSEMADLPLWLAVQSVGLPHSKQLQYHKRSNAYE